NYQLQNSNPDQDFFSASMNGRLLKVSFNNSFSYTKGNLNDSINVANRLAGRIGKLNLTHNLNYRDIQPKFRPNAANIETFTGDVSISGRLSQDSRIAGGFTYDIKDKAKISLFRLSTGMRLSKKINFNSQIDYKPQSTVKWRVNNSLSWSSKKATFYSSLSYDADDQWAVSLGLTFSLGYDEHQDDWLFSSQNIIAGGTMDINSYLDQNNNHQLDEGDLALPGVKYGHLKQWEGISSNDQGRVSLPFVSSYSPTLISPSSTFGVTPSTSSYAVYTHPGSRIKAQIPFTVRTSVSGFVLLTDEDGDPLTNTNVFLNNVKGKTIDQTDTDDDGYFEFNNVRPGNYTVLVDPTALGSRTLRSDPGSLQFNTMPAGGFLELGVLAAVPASQNVSESTRVVKATIDNYEPLEDVEKLLGIRTFASDAGDTTIAGPSPSDISTTTRPDNFAETDNAADNISSPNPLIPVSTQVLQSASVLAPQAAAPVPQLKRSSVQSPSAATLPNAGSGFALQFGVYSTASLTNDLIKTLKNSGINALSYFDKQIMGYRVLVGPFNSQAQARLKSSEIKGRGFDNFTRSWPAQVSPPAKSSSTSSTQANSASGIPAALPEKGFAIQMMVAQSQKSIDDITSNNRLGNDLYQIKKAHQGGTLNVLLKGHYLTRVQAQQAISGLPAQWRSKTWIRPVGDLRAEQVN
ncbi:MAG: septal ring-binding cell division protein DamX, partial [Phenylobacterium sp.]